MLADVLVHFSTIRMLRHRRTMYEEDKVLLLDHGDNQCLQTRYDSEQGSRRGDNFKRKLLAGVQIRSQNSSVSCARTRFRIAFLTTACVRVFCLDRVLHSSTVLRRFWPISPVGIATRKSRSFSGLFLVNVLFFTNTKKETNLRSTVRQRRHLQ